MARGDRERRRVAGHAAARAADWQAIGRRTAAIYRKAADEATGGGWDRGNGGVLDDRVTGSSVRSTNSSRVHLEAFVRRAAGSVAAGARVLDAGAGHSPYREHFAHVEYESADFERAPGKRYAASDYVCDLAAIPVEDHRYDLVLLSQVLEQVPEPGTVLAELRRVLKPGGTIWASAPLFYEEHEVPYDFFRYTQYGLRHRGVCAALRRAHRRTARLAVATG